MRQGPDIECASQLSSQLGGDCVGPFGSSWAQVIVSVSAFSRLQAPQPISEGTPIQNALCKNSDAMMDRVQENGSHPST